MTVIESLPKQIESLYIFIIRLITTEYFWSDAEEDTPNKKSLRIFMTMPKIKCLAVKGY